MVKMRYNLLGSTDMKVSHIGLGGAAFGNLYGATNQEQNVALIRECISSGINYMETGPWYGQGASEETFGKALKGIPRNQYYISSKIGRYSKDMEHMFDFSAERTALELDKTLSILGTEYVDIIQIHDISFAQDLRQLVTETLPVLYNAVKDGKARYIGLCDYSIDLMQEFIEENDVKVDTVLTYAKSTLIDNRLQNHIKFFKDHRIGVINAAATGMGLLTNSGPQDWHPARPEIKALCSDAAEYCKSQGVELGRLATWFSLSQPGIDTNVCGISNSEQLRDTLELMEKGLDCTEKTMISYIQNNILKSGPMHWDYQERHYYFKEMNKFS